LIYYFKFFAPYIDIFLIFLAQNVNEHIPKLYSDLASGSGFHKKIEILKELKIICRDSM
jgi:hypothetical protein